ncbi:MAG: LysR family transcriptional regulator [Chromatiaceae bacterium]|nr:MAG: LysR family transcriptional regulator [Chromatiaceae bacterium]
MILMRSVRDLKIVRALARHRNFARASEELAMSQPNLSRALARLEELTGVTLFERSRTAVQPTPYAEIILERCDAVIEGFDDINRLLEVRRAEADEDFRVSVGPYSAVAVAIAGFLDNFTAYRAARSELVTRDWRSCLEDVLERRSDLAITSTQSAHAVPELETESLGGGAVAFFCARTHPLAQAERIDWSDLMRFPWASMVLPGWWLKLLPKDLGRAGRCDPETGEFVPAICVDSFDAMVAAVLAGQALSAAPPTFIRNQLERGDLVLLQFHEPWMQMEYGLVWRRDQPWSRGLRRFVEKLRQAQAQTEFSLPPASGAAAPAGPEDTGTPPACDPTKAV